eukprot:CAMPEP_0201171492 /NCGR_PEP_ID=MMETSP0851-20130426/88225_1 /ASSEMBLY_ACC=CAM_ASM_000631 /TAXON_ID=183588 /ORGANISM="Pseudo-nitzschia fraudulenta, Strain WWA7" /LENGTH=355 /DNA_ID=CAMNT_0047453803 /DNA_START=119 /DNA_END=1186 /DNA_ORIENTATION=-
MTALIVSLLLSASARIPILATSCCETKRYLEPITDESLTDDTILDHGNSKAVPKQTITSAVYHPVPEPSKGNIRLANALTQREVTAKSLTQELYGIIDLPKGATTIHFQEIFDAHVESYFESNVNAALLLDSKITVKNVLIPSNAVRSLQINKQRIMQEIQEQHKGSSVIITYNQHLTYYLPVEDKILALKSLVTLPFLTESGRNEFSSLLKDSDDAILQHVIGVSKVNLPPQPPIDPLPTEPPKTLPPTTLPIALVKAPPTPSPEIQQPTNTEGINPAPVLIQPPGGAPPPSLAPIFPTTGRPTPPRKKANPLIEDDAAGSRGINGFIVLGVLMSLLFVAFTIKMKYCMGEYVD